MIRRIAFITALMAAPFAQAGDSLEGYFYVVGSIPSTVPAKDMTDFAAPEFRDTIAALSNEWSAKCEVPVEVWHTNLMFNEDTPWTPDYWFAYIAVGSSKAKAIGAAPTTDCMSGSYIKYGLMGIPTTYQICAAGPEYYPDTYYNLCN